MLNSYFYKKLNYNNNLFQVGSRLKVRYYDQYKRLHLFEGVCVRSYRVANDIYITLYQKQKGFYFSFFLNSPLIVAIFKK